MDWQAAIDWRAVALRRIVAGFVAFVGASRGAAADVEELVAVPPTLARHRHRALLRLVRPAEAAARRLIIALALAAPAAEAAGVDRPAAGAADAAGAQAAAEAGAASPTPHPRRASRASRSPARRSSLGPAPASGSPAAPPRRKGPRARSTPRRRASCACR